MSQNGLILAEVLRDRGLITEEDLTSLVQERKEQESLQAALLRLGFVGKQTLLEALSQATGMALADATNIEASAELLKKVPVQFIHRARVLPLRRDGQAVVVAVSDPFDVHAIDELRLLLGCQIEPVLVAEKDLEDALRHAFGVGAATVEQMVDDDDDGLTVVAAADESGSTDLAEEAGLIRFVRQILVEAVRDRASDIHFEPMEGDFRVRYRVDGVLHTTRTPPQIKQFQAAIVSRLKIMSQLDIAEKRKPQDGRLLVRAEGRDVDVRVSVIPTVHGEAVVLRLLDREAVSLDLRTLGIPDDISSSFRELILQPHGIVLVTGPTGSGKTTTLYGALQEINTEGTKIVTVEDPVEYKLHGIAQIQVRPKVGLTFAAGLRSILRHDPDVILIGEIRDVETAKIAIQAALTGHLVFSTLHTNDAPSAATRLVEMGIEPYLVASTVEGMLAQRLVRRICPHCKIYTQIVDPLLLERVGLGDMKQVAVGSGCETCRQTGFKGRQGVFEWIVLDAALRQMILDNQPSSLIKRSLIDGGLITLRERALELVRQGVTTLEEVTRVCKVDR